jgi:hypothetical protein
MKYTAITARLAKDLSNQEQQFKLDLNKHIQELDLNKNTLLSTTQLFINFKGHGNSMVAILATDGVNVCRKFSGKIIINIK